MEGRKQGSDRPGGSRLRSVRMSIPVAEALQHRAESSGKSQNALVQRYVDEGLRRDAHHFIDFRQGIGGGVPIIAGTRVQVGHVIRSYKHGESVKEIADDLGLEAAKVQACVAYYAEFTEEIDRQIAQEGEFAERARNAWLREQQVANTQGAGKGKKKAS